MTLTFEVLAAGDASVEIAPGVLMGDFWSDSGGSPVALDAPEPVEITVDAGNQRPPVAGDDAFATDEDSALTTGNVLGNDSDADGGTLSVSAVNGSAADVGSQIVLGSGALLTLNGDGSFAYDPNGAFEGLDDGDEATDSFTYTVSDGQGGSDDATVTITVDGVTDIVPNVPPVAGDDAFATDEDSALTTGNVLGNDSDADGGTLSVSAVNGSAADVGSQIVLGSGALLTLNGDGSFAYDPNGAFEGLDDGDEATDSFTYTVSDGQGGSDDATVTITVDGVTDIVPNVPPVAGDDAFATDEDSALTTGNVLGNDSDADGGTLSVSAVNGSAADVGSQIVLGSGALLTLNGDGSFAYDPNGAFEGLDDGDEATDSFTYTVSDGQGGSDDATVTITVDGVTDIVPNVPPVAGDDAFATDEDSALTTGNVLGNDSDADGGTLSVSAVNGSAADVGSQIVLGSGALLTLNGDGSFAYDPNGAFEGLDDGDEATDSFTYTVSDGQGGSDDATVTITVDGVTDIVPNVPPVAGDDAFATDEDSALTTGNVLGNDSDADGGTLSVSAVNGSAADVGSQIVLGSGALLTLNGDGSFAYDPNGAFEGLDDGDEATDSFTYTVSDGQGGSDDATVTITVDGVTDIVPNVPPVAGDDAFATDEDSALTTGNVLGNDSDADGGTLSVSAVNGSAADVGSQIVLGSGALLTLNGDGSFAYDPNGAFEGLDDGDEATDSFTYTVSDGQGGSDDATVTITVDGVTDIVPNVPPVAGDDAFATDEDSALTTGNVLGNDSDADGGTLSVSAVNGSAADVGSQIVLGSGALLTLNGDGSFAYDPNGAFEGLDDGDEATDSFTYTVSDGQGGSDDATVTITVDGVTDIVPNVPPVAGDDAFATDEDSALTTGNVLGNDSDADGGTLSVSAVNGSAADVGSQIVLGSGALLTLNGDGSFAYDPNGAFEGLDDGDEATDSFTYTVSDGQGGSDDATVTITVDGVTDIVPNVPPVAGDDAFATDEDSALTTGNVLGNDSDADGGTLSVSAVNGSAADVGSQIVLGSGALLTLNGDGSFAYDPNGAFEGLDDGDEATDSFTYTVSDGQGGSDDATVTITVDGVTDIVPNVPPVAGDDAFATDEDSALTTGNVLGNDSDADGGTLSVSAVNGSAADVGSQIVLGSGALLTLNGDGSFAYDPNGAFEGLDDGDEATDSFTYTVSDGQGGSDDATVTITVDGVTDIVPNVPPVAGDDAFATDEDSALTTGNVLGNDSDADGGTLSVSAVNGSAADVGSQIVLGSGALLTLNGDGSFAYDPNGAFEGLDDGDEATDSFTYTVSDGQGGSDDATVTITVDGVTDIVQPPQDFAGLLTIDRDGSLVTVTATSRDGVAALDGLLAFGNGAQATNFATPSFEGADAAGPVSGGVDFDLRTFAAPGLFDEFSFNLDPTATITAIGEFGVVFTGDPVDPGDPTRPTVALSATPLSGTEAGSTQIVLTVTASAPVTGDQSVALGLSGSATAADFVGGLPASITILDGERAGSATVTVADDSLVEGYRDGDVQSVDAK